MPAIEKRGNGYRITVSQGYDIDGKQLRTKMTWYPEKGMTPKQIEKELNRQAILFEERVRSAGTHDGSIKLVDFITIFLRDHAPNLKKKTVYDYREKLKVIRKALGHIRLRDLRPGHISEFYANLRAPGMRAKIFAVAKPKLISQLSIRGTMADINRRTGVNLGTIRSARNGKRISYSSAQRIADAFGLPVKQLFEQVRDMTPLDARTIRGYHQVLSAVLGQAVVLGYIQSNPAIKAIKPAVRKHEAPYLEEEDARRLLELLLQEPIYWRTPMMFDLLSGMRRQELLGLRWQDVDMDRQMIYIRQTSNYTPNDGVYTDTPKTTTSSRPLKVARSAILLLQEYKQWQDTQREKLGDAWQGTDDRIFTNAFGVPRHPDSLTKWFTAFISRSGLPKVTVHSMRHTYASLMIFDGVNLVAVSHQLGHAQTSTTANIYSHVIAAAEALAASSFDRFDDVILENKPQTNPKILKIG